MMTTWLDTLLSYTFTIVHRPGILNVLPDHLSRLFPPSFREGRKVDKSTLINKVHINPMVIAQQDFLDLKIPEIDEQPLLLHKKHLLGHFGADAMVNAIHEDGVTWPTMKKEAVELVQQCIDCQRFNITRQGFHPLKSIHVELPGDHWAIDLVGPFPTSYNTNHYLLVMVDIATRFVLLRAIPDKKATTIAEYLFKSFCDFGFTKIIQSDNGTEFVNKVIKAMAEIARIDHRLITPYHPRANGIAERYVQTATRAIRKQLHGVKKSWD